MGIITYNDTSFLMDGKEYTIVSGAMHYFRIPRRYWHDRLDKLKQCGFNTVETLTPIARALNGEHFGLIWDIGHTHAPYGDDWELFYRAMRPYICHVHIKDKCGSALVLPGEGEIPISAIVRRMLEDGYDGFFSLEWERKWHPELLPLEDALERYVRLMKG